MTRGSYVPMTTSCYVTEDKNANVTLVKMVRVTLHYLTRKGSRNAPKHGKDSKEHARKLTHLFLNDQYIDSIGDISACINLKVMFLQNNILEKIDNLEFASSLTHLYLQRNKLCKIQGFNGLISLQKLYLGYNSISVVEGLENMKNLLELHIENQRLCPGEEIIFDPRTIASLGHSLQTLNLQGNHLTSLEDLVGLDSMRTLLVASNNLSDVTKIQAFLTTMPSLIELDMRDNPVVEDYKNCNRILASAHNLRTFNEKQISVTTLDFMKKFEEHQQKTMLRQPLQAPSDLIQSISELAYNLPEALAKDVTSTIFMDASAKNAQGDGNLAEGSSTAELNICAGSEGGPYFHFPAFKSSTYLQYDGHTIPKPFHRQIILGAQLGNKQSPAQKQSQRPASIFAKRNGVPLGSKVVTRDCIQQDLQDRLRRTDCGDMICENQSLPVREIKCPPNVSGIGSKEDTKRGSMCAPDNEKETTK